MYSCGATILPVWPPGSRSARSPRRRPRAGAQCGLKLVGQRLQHLRVVLAAAQAAATRHDDARRRQFRTVQLRHFTAHEPRLAGIGRRFDLLDRGAAAFRCHRIKRGRTHRDHLDRIARLHRRDRVACVDRALERIGRHHRRDLGDLCDIQLRRNARRDVLAIGRCRRNDVRVAVRDGHHRRFDVLGQTVGQLRRIGQQHLRHPEIFAAASLPLAHRVQQRA